MPSTATQRPLHKSILLQLFALLPLLAAQRCLAAPAAADALVLLSSRAAAGLAAECRRYVADNGGRLDGALGPGIFYGHVPAALEAELATRCGAVFYREEITEPESLRAAYGPAGVMAAQTWNNNLEAMPAPQPPPGDKYLQVVLGTDGNSYKVVSKKIINKPRPMFYRQPASEGSRYVEAVDAAGNTLATQSLDDPTQGFYDYFEDPEPQQAGGRSPGRKVMKGGSYKAAKAEMTLTLPYDTRIKTLRVSHRKAPAGGRGQQRKNFKTVKASSAPAAADLDLKSVLELGTVTGESQ
ncbi:MAG TPA: hypothetical protein PKI19_00150 [Elusimicrobiales bacterium]|nr:hypothetical protein [Elusimicrobiales bacterium]